ncbi:MAG TPA: NADAR family protein [Candidatus Limnocylindrales bacterium]
MPPSSISDLITLQSSGTPLKMLFFWGHRPQRDGTVGAGCLSQWWPSPFEVDGRRFGSAEHFMMWSKAMLFGDEATAARILAARSPGEAKALGRNVNPFDETVWERERFGIVVAGSVAKFSQHADLKDFLVGTRNRVLVEASPLDRIWGIGLAAGDPDASDPARWKGGNLLGFALMHARELLRGTNVLS